MFHKFNKTSQSNTYDDTYNELKEWLRKCIFDEMAFIRKIDPNYPNLNSSMVSQSVKHMSGEYIYHILPQAHDPQQLKKILDMIPEIANEIFSTPKLQGQVVAILTCKNKRITELFPDTWHICEEMVRVQAQLSNIPTNICTSEVFKTA